MEIVRKMAEKFPENRIALKLLEEVTELSEVPIKRETKHDDLRPPEEKLTEELGDVLFRMDILIEKMGIKDKMEARYQEKAEQTAKWFKDKHETIKQ